MKALGYLRTLALGALVAFTVISTGRAGEFVPVKAAAAGEITSLTYVADPALAPPGTTLAHGTTEAVGHGSHLGKYTLSGDFEVHLEIIDGQFYVVSEGNWEATSASGDILRGTFRHEELMGFVNGQLAGLGDFTGTAEFTGGTGRFEGATGFETTVGRLFPQPNGLEGFVYEHEGLISSVGSRKRNQ